MIVTCYYKLLHRIPEFNKLLVNCSSFIIRTMICLQKKKPPVLSFFSPNVYISDWDTLLRGVFDILDRQSLCSVLYCKLYTLPAVLLPGPALYHVTLRQLNTKGHTSNTNSILSQYSIQTEETLSLHRTLRLFTPQEASSPDMSLRDTL